MTFIRGSELGGDLEADVAIVGAGAAGITIAQALAGTGLRIVLIESGGLRYSAEAQALQQAASIGAPVRPEEGRFRVFGGTTTAWTGRCCTLDPIDFRARPWIRDSGWPLGAAELAPFYRAAESVCGFATAWEDDPEPRERVARLPGRPSEIEPFVWRFSSLGLRRYQHWGERYRASLAGASNVRVLIEADLVGLTSSGAGRISGARVRTRAGRPIRVDAQVVVLCCGGIENARLLLNAAEALPAAFAEVEPVLGRYFMQHPRIVSATIDADRAGAARLQHLLNRFRRRRGLQYETGLALSERAQAENRLLNASAVLRFTPRAGIDGFAGRITRAARLPGRVSRRLRGIEPLLDRPAISLVVDLEQEPDRDSRILLAPDRDRLGLRRAVIDWRLGPLEAPTADRLTRAACAWIERLGLGTGRAVPYALGNGTIAPDAIQESYHHLGATRMSDRPGTGVVDAALKVHGTDNLFVCGGSVFPTGGHGNPTFTIVALALRLATHLAERLGRPLPGAGDAERAAVDPVLSGPT